MASLFGQLLRQALAVQDEEADIIVAASPPPTKATLAGTESNKIREFLDLADSNEIDIGARLAAYRECNAILSKLPQESAERTEVLARCSNIVCPYRGELMLPLCAKPNSFHRIVEEAAPLHPDANAIFAQILGSSSSPTEPVAHPSGISCLALAFANLVALCKSYPDNEDSTTNLTSGLLDLYPLYGTTGEDAKNTVRVVESDEIGWGLLKADAFFEQGERLVFLSPATTVLLILFSRNHNSIARKLFSENHLGQWLEPTALDESRSQAQDDEIFNLAKRVNCAIFRQMVASDFLKGLVGLSPVDDLPVIDLVNAPGSFNSHANSAEFSLLYGWSSMLSAKDIEVVEENLPQIEALDGDVTPEDLEEFMCEYEDRYDLDRGTRDLIGLTREDGNVFNSSDLAAVLQTACQTSASAFRAQGSPEAMRLFDVSAMERARKWKVCSLNKFREVLGLARYSSFEEWCGNEEVAQAAEDLYETVDNLELYPGLRGEKTVDGKGFGLGQTLTYALITDIVQIIRSDPGFKEDEQLDKVTPLGSRMIQVNPNNGAFGSPAPTVVLDSLPNEYNHNNALALFPFVTPEKAKALFEDRAREAAAAGAPMIPGLDDIDFETPKATTTHNITDPDAARQISNSGKFENPLADDLTKFTDGLGVLLGFDKDSHAADDNKTISSFLADRGAAKRYSDFLSNAVKRYLLRHRKPSGQRYEVDYQTVINCAVASFAAEVMCGITLDQPKKLTAEDFFQKLKDINDTLVGSTPAQDKFVVQKRADDAIQLIRRLIENGIARAIEDPHEHTWLESIVHFLREILLDEPRSYNNASHYFLARLAASGKDRKVISANVLGFAVSSSIQFAKTLGTAVAFYLDDAHADAREELKTLAGQPDASTDYILGYAREAERLSRVGPTRLNALEDFDVTLSSGEVVEIKRGDRVIVDPIAEDRTIDPTRPIVKSFVPSLEAGPLRTIFALRDIQPKGRKLFSYIDSKKDARSDVKKDRVPWVQRVFDAIFVVLALYLLSWTWTAVGNAINAKNPFVCSSPRHMRPWEPYTLLPGPDNRTLPFIITLDSPTKRRLTFVDLDQRDMRFKVSVNGRKKAISSDFVLDQAVACGDRVQECLEKGFSTAQVIVPRGKKVVKLEWIGKDEIPGTNLIEWGAHANRRFAWRQDAC